MPNSPSNLGRHPFRQGGGDKVYHLHGLEKALLIVLITQLVFLPWALGGMRLWAQYTAASLSLLALVIALVPRHYTDLHHAGANLRLIMWPKLLHFPFFWLGLLYFGYVLIQIYNPAWQFFRFGDGWAVMAIDHVTWLPHGVADAPIAMMNGWRVLLIQGSAWLLVCAMWVGLTRRKSIRVLLNVIALNGTGLALVVLLQRLTGTQKLFGIWDAPSSYFAGSFIYKNHAGAFFLLILATCLGLAWWHMVRAERELRKSHPGMIYVFLSLIVFIALAFTYARAASILGATLLLLAGLGYGWRLIFHRSGATHPLVSTITALLGIGFLTLCVVSFNTDSIWQRFARLTKEDAFTSITSRRIARQATLELAQSSLWFGHGAGNFRYVFPQTQQNHPEIWRRRFYNRQGTAYTEKRIFWEYAHNDYAQLLAELGLIGAVFFCGTVLLILGAARRNALWRQPFLLLLLAGPLFVAFSAWTDFPTHNPAILVGVCAITALTLRWATLARAPNPSPDHESALH